MYSGLLREVTDLSITPTFDWNDDGRIDPNDPNENNVVGSYGLTTTAFGEVRESLTQTTVRIYNGQAKANVSRNRTHTVHSVDGSRVSSESETVSDYEFLTGLLDKTQQRQTSRGITIDGTRSVGMAASSFDYGHGENGFLQLLQAQDLPVEVAEFQQLGTDVDGNPILWRFDVNNDGDTDGVVTQLGGFTASVDVYGSRSVALTRNDWMVVAGILPRA